MDYAENYMNYASEVKIKPPGLILTCTEFRNLKKKQPNPKEETQPAQTQTQQAEKADPEAEAEAARVAESEQVKTSANGGDFTFTQYRNLKRKPPKVETTPETRRVFSNPVEQLSDF